MSMYLNVDAAFRKIAPEVFSAWFIMAPASPDEDCMVMIPIPDGVMTEGDRASLENAIASLFMVRSVKVTDGLIDAVPMPGIRVRCIPWHVARKRKGVFEPQGAA